MQNNPSILFIFIFILFSIGLSGQSLETDIYVRPVDPVVNDTIVIHHEILHTPAETIIATDTIIPGDKGISSDSISTDEEAFKPDAAKALWFGAIIPGYGQIVNRKYWKLPIVYGGFMGCAYAITWFSNEYQFYKIAYRDISDSDPTTKSYMDLIPEGMTVEQIFGSETIFATRLKSYQDNYRRYRDWSIVISIIYYGLTILEAYVDAHLYDFDISPDLAMRFQPAIINNDVVLSKSLNEYDPFGKSRTLGSSNAVGIQWSIRLK